MTLVVKGFNEEEVELLEFALDAAMFDCETEAANLAETDPAEAAKRLEQAKKFETLRMYIAPGDTIDEGEDG